MEVVFLGINDVGLDLYEWLCNRDDASVQALLTEKEQLSIVHNLQPELIISIGFNYLIPSDILGVPSEGAINLHPALLPYNRGKSPNVWSIVEDTPAGVSLHYMDPQFDTGDIIAQRPVSKDFEDTGKRLHRRLEEAQIELFTNTWPAIRDGEIEPRPQEEDAGTYHTTKDFLQLCEIKPDERVRAKELLDRLRALTFPPFDNAFIEIEGKKYYIDIELRKEGEEASKEELSEGLISSY
jgi:methionyl-tRNA formyltransferase